MPNAVDETYPGQPRTGRRATPAGDSVSPGGSMTRRLAVVRRREGQDRLGERRWIECEGEVPLSA